VRKPSTDRGKRRKILGEEKSIPEGGKSASIGRRTETPEFSWLEKSTAKDIRILNQGTKG